MPGHSGRRRAELISWQRWLRCIRPAPPREAKLRRRVATSAQAPPHSARPTRKPNRFCGKTAVSTTITTAPTTVPIIRNQPLRKDAPRCGWHRSPPTCPPNRRCRARARTRRRGRGGRGREQPKQQRPACGPRHIRYGESRAPNPAPTRLDAYRPTSQTVHRGYSPLRKLRSSLSGGTGRLLAELWMCEADQRVGALGRGQAFEVCGSELGDDSMRVDAPSRDRSLHFYTKAAPHFGSGLCIGAGHHQRPEASLNSTEALCLSVAVAGRPEAVLRRELCEGSATPPLIRKFAYERIFESR